MFHRLLAWCPFVGLLYELLRGVSLGTRTNQFDHHSNKSLLVCQGLLAAPQPPSVTDKLQGFKQVYHTMCMYEVRPIQDNEGILTTLPSWPKHLRIGSKFPTSCQARQNSGYGTDMASPMKT
eukprot:2834159-Amphidinium_carterae.1